MWTAYVLYLIGIITGFVLLARSFEAGHRSMDAHAILGLVLTAFILVQPWVGWYIHILWKNLTANVESLPAEDTFPGSEMRRNMRRRWLAQSHVWAGQVIVLGALINGGLGVYSEDFQVICTDNLQVSEELCVDSKTGQHSGSQEWYSIVSLVEYWELFSQACQLGRYGVGDTSATRWKSMSWLVA
jgi:hypothetical protein